MNPNTSNAQTLKTRLKTFGYGFLFGFFFVIWGFIISLMQLPKADLQQNLSTGLIAAGFVFIGTAAWKLFFPNAPIL